MTYTPDAGEYGAGLVHLHAPTTAPPTPRPATASITISRAPACDDVARRTAVGEPVSVPLALHRSRRRHVDAVGRRRPRARLAGPDRRRRGHLHARRRLPRRGLVQLPRERRGRGLGSGHRVDHGDARAELRRRRAHHGGRRPGHGAARLHGPRRRPGHARDRRRAVEGLARRDLRRFGDLHAGRGRVRRRQLHLHGVRRRGDLRAGDRLDHDHAPAELPGRGAPDRGRLLGQRPADLHGSRRRSADALDRRRALEGLAGRDLRADR